MSVQLLEFKPKETISASRLIDEDVWFSRTPDLPELRYSKKILVFIWDEFKTYRSMDKELGVRSAVNFNTVCFSANTKMEFLPFRNKARTKATKHDMLLPTNKDWMCFTYPLSARKDSPAKVTGRLLTVDLKTIQALDQHYCNEHLHVRKKHQIVTANNTEVSAWMYTIPTSMFTKYDAHEKEYQLVNGFEPYHMTKPNGVTFSSVHKPLTV